MAKNATAGSKKAGGIHAAAMGILAKLSGQSHHIISRSIKKALKRHKVLGKEGNLRGQAGVTQAKDLRSHCGYQDWHRKYDAEVVEWLDGNPAASKAEFESFLKRIYDRSDMKDRFPGGWGGFKGD
ncbi:MAG: hypothetical protein IPK87_14965 [Planctomycetes bacterium]|nr:hypothetical protein [Planctomycetota bacterium]